jgi:hypothetical protein
MLQLIMIRKTVVNGLLLGMAMVGFASGQGETGCSMNFRVLDVAGHTVSLYAVESFLDAGGRQYADRFSGLRGRVPCQSRYRYILRPIGVKSDVADLKGDIDYLYRRELWMTLVADPRLVIDGGKVGVAHSISPENYVLNGRVVPSDGKRLWLRIRSALGADLEETEIDTQGRFQLYGGLPAGPCIVSVIDSDGKVRYLSTLIVLNRHPTAPLLLQMPSSPPVATTIQ